MQNLRLQSALAACSVALCAALTACSVLPTPPQAMVRYDLGAAPAFQTSAQGGALAPLALTDMQAPLQVEGNLAVRYRLAYADKQVLHAYTEARWSLPPSQMVQQRLREHLGQGGRIVLSAEAGVIPPSVQGRQAPVLRLALEEFSHVFTSAEQGVGWVRVRATLINPAPQGDVLLAQRLFEGQVPATAANAAAGVQALAQGVNDIGVQMNQWVQALNLP